jgi:hypothetical protein
MRKILFLSFFIALFTSFVSAQTETAIKPDLVSGEVTAISAEKLVLQTANGALDALLSDKTVYKKVAPDNPKASVASSFAEIGVGDKVIVSGVYASDRKSIPVRTVYLMTKADISQKQNKERAEWKTRGIKGRVTAVNATTKEITLVTPALMGSKTTILTAKDDAVFLRYAQDSSTFEDAKKSSFTDIAAGDSIEAIGDKGEDGATFKAEKILTGAFQMIVGTVKATDAAKGEITITNVQTKKDTTVVVGKNTLFLKQFPADIAQKMAMAQAMAANGTTPIRPPQGNQTTQATPQQNPNQMQAGGGRGTLDDMLERFPNITVADLKVGEMIAVSSSKSAAVDRIAAIKLLSGIEPFVKAQQMMAAGANRQGGGGANSSFTIPGLDGGGLP